MCSCSLSDHIKLKMKLSQVFGRVSVLLAVIAYANSQAIIREKRTIEFLLQKLADSLGFRVIPKHVLSKNSETIRLNQNMKSNQPNQQPFAPSFDIFGLNDVNDKNNPRMLTRTQMMQATTTNMPPIVNASSTVSQEVTSMLPMMPQTSIATTTMAPMIPQIHKSAMWPSSTTQDSTTLATPSSTEDDLTMRTQAGIENIEARRHLNIDFDQWRTWQQTRNAPEYFEHTLQYYEDAPEHYGNPLKYYQSVPIYQSHIKMSSHSNVKMHDSEERWTYHHPRQMYHQ